MHVYGTDGRRETINTLLFGKDSEMWMHNIINELGRLARRNTRGVASIDAVECINKEEVPTNSKVTYANFICKYKPLKSESHRIRLIAEGDKLEYNGDTGVPGASLIETKILINIVVSGAKKVYDS